MDTSRESPRPADAPPSVTDFVDELVVALAALRIHEGVAGAAPDVGRALARTLARLLDDLGRTRLELALERGCLVHDGAALLGATLCAARLVHALERLGARGLAFERGISTADLLALTRLLERRTQGPREPADAAADLRAAGCSRLELLAEVAAPGRSPVAARELEGPAHVYQRLVDHLQELTVRICRRESFGLEPTRALVEDLVGRVEREPGALFSLSRYERFDAFTFGHSIRVALLALEFAGTQTRNAESLARLGLAALLHDVGKAWLPFDVLYSSASLDDEARAVMEQHALHGGAILAAMDADPLCVAVAFGHHLRHAGGGYPTTVHAPQLSTATRLVKICDVFEALTAPRPHRPALPPTRAYRIMLAMTGHFDPRLLRRFIEIHGIHPVGTHVRLSTGELARVTAQSRLLDGPRVVLTTTPDGAPIPPDPDSPLDLSSDRERTRRRIVATLEPPATDSRAA
jgi:HD-GYP domain-containing protein (c-di-GMP phosphodiesterase class II)